MSGQGPTQVDHEGDTCGVFLEISFHSRQPSNWVFAMILRWHYLMITFPLNSQRGRCSEGLPSHDCRVNDGWRRFWGLISFSDCDGGGEMAGFQTMAK